jgi:type VI secretion system protein ImpG
MYKEEIDYRVFLEELQDLAEFRLEYSMDNPSAGLDADDPDVKRIIEVLAFFGARTKNIALRSWDSTNRRLYQQFFSYMLTPIPSMAMMQAIPNGRLTESLDVLAGTEFGLEPEEGGLVMFRNSRPLRVLPLTIESVKQESLPDKGIRILLTFVADFPLNEQPEIINLHINYLNDFTLSHKVMHFMRESLLHASVQYGQYDPEQTFLNCEFNLNICTDNIATDEWRHPIEVERSYFHFPQQDLFLELDIPSGPRNWKQFTIALDCNKPWLRQLRLHQNIFQLFVVPLANNHRSMAQPIICDGTLERYTIRHPKPELGFCLQNVLGVYEVGEKGMLPFRPGVLAGGNGSYELEKGPRQDSGGDLYWLVPHFPSAFQKPRTLVVEVLWQQPWYDRILQSQYKINVFRKQVPGIEWELVDTVIPHAENNQFTNVTRYLSLLTLMHINTFSAQNLRDLLSAMGSVTDGKFKNVFDSFVDLRLEEEPLGEETGHKIKQIYYMQFKPYLDVTIDIIEPFILHVGLVLDSWISEALVEVRWEMLDDINKTILIGN